MAADDDYRCDLCGTLGKERDMTLCAPELFQNAVRAGLRPEQSISLGLVSREDFEADWAVRALMDETGWGLCQDCVAKVQGFLVDDGSWSVRGPRAAV